MRKMFSQKQIEEMISEGSAEKVEELVEGGALDNAKPIYCHPITLELTATYYKLRLTCLIFNNDSTEFTWASFKEFLATFNGRIMITGAVTDIQNSFVVIASQLRVTGSAIYVYGLTTTGDVADANTNTINLLESAFNSISLIDNVNKVN